MVAKLLRGGFALRAAVPAFAAALLLFPGAASAVSTTLDLNTGGSESEKSFYQPDDGNKKSYSSGSSLTLDFDYGNMTVDILDFFLPGAIATIGMDFRFTDVPDVLFGTMTMEGSDQVGITFPDVEVEFDLDGFEGTMVFDLTTYGGTIPAGCAGRDSNQTVSGSHLDLNTGDLALVGVLCPYEGRFNGNPNFDPTVFDEAFRLFVRGNIANPPTPVPEPGTLAMLGAGLAGLALRGRKRS